MTSVRVIAIEPCNGKSPGEDFEVSEREANKLVERRLVRLAVDGAPNNKMRKPPSNKGNVPSPSPGGGGEQPSSPSPADPASPPRTAQSSRRGGQPGSTGSVSAPRKAMPVKTTPGRSGA
jgi:hypothetical protein